MNTNIYKLSVTSNGNGATGGAIVLSNGSDTEWDMGPGYGAAGIQVGGATMPKSTSIPDSFVPHTGNTLGESSTNVVLLCIADADGVAMWTPGSGSTEIGDMSDIAVLRPGFDWRSGLTPSFSQGEIMSDSIVLNGNDKIAINSDLKVLSTNVSGATFLISETGTDVTTRPYGNDDNSIRGGFDFVEIPNINQMQKLQNINIKRLPMYLNTYYESSSGASIKIVNNTSNTQSQVFVDGGLIKLEDVYDKDYTSFTNTVSRPSNSYTAARFVIDTSWTSGYYGKFSGCTSLVTSRVLYQSLLANNTFEGCSKLMYAELDDGIHSIGEYAFRGSGIQKVEHGDISQMGVGVFSGCTNLEEFDFGTGSTLNSIPDYTFAGCTSLTSVTLPDTITSIGTHAFKNCTHITNITIPSACTSISDSAFEGCTSLTSVTLGNYLNLISIGSNAFKGCTNLKRFGSRTEHNGIYIWKFPDNLTTLGTGAFSGCTNLEPEYYEGGSSDTYAFTIPSTLTTVGNNVFTNCYKISAVTYNASVMGDYMFYNCTGLTKVDFGEIETIAPYAFYKCRSLTHLFLPNVKTVKQYAFYSAMTLADAVFGVNVTNVSGYSFGYCAALKNVVFEGATVPTIVSTAFKTGTPTNGHIFYIQNGMSGITTTAFNTGWDTNKMSRFSFNTSSMTINNITDSLFTGTNQKWLGVFSFDNMRKSVDRQLSGVIYRSYGSSTKRHYIPFYNSAVNGAFSGRTQLTKIELAPKVTTIGVGAFSGCTSLNYVDIAATGTTSLQNNCFRGCTSLASLTLPSFTGGTDCFSGCTTLKRIDYKGSVGPGCSSTTFRGIASYGTLYHPNCLSSALSTVLSTSAYYLGYYHWVDGDAEGDAYDTFMYSAGTNTNTVLCNYVYTQQFPTGGGDSGSTSGTTATTAYMYVDGVQKYIASATTFNTSTVNNVHVVKYPSNYICNAAFSGNTSLYSVNLGSDTTSIGVSAFTSCSNMVSFSAPNITTSIGAYAFSLCTKLNTLSLDGTFTSVPLRMCYGDSALTNVHISSSVTTINGYAFSNCQNLTAIDDLRKVHKLDPYAFGNCSSLTSISFGDDSLPHAYGYGIGSLGEGAFSNCSLIESIDLGPNPSATTLGAATFSGCTKLSQIELPPNINSIGNYDFAGCSSLSSVTIPSKVATLAPYAFSNCRELNAIYCLTSSATVSSNTFINVKTGGTLYYRTGGNVASRFLTKGSYYLGYYGWNGHPLGNIRLTFNITSSNQRVYIGAEEKAVGILSGTTYLPPADYVVFPSTGNNTITVLWADVKSYNLENSSELYSLVYSANTMCPSFQNCTQLVSATMYTGNNLDTLNNTFNGCTALQTLNIQNTSIQELSGSCIGCTSLTGVTLPSTLTTIGQKAFDGCVSLTGITIPNSVHTIGDFAFSSSGLQNVNLNNVSTIGYCSFSQSSLVSVTGNTLSTLGTGNAFVQCYSLTNVHMSGSTFTEIPNNGFNGCTSLQVVNLPNLTKIGTGAFYGTASLTNFKMTGYDKNTISNVNIDNYAFYGSKLPFQSDFILSSTDNSHPLIVGNYAFNSAEGNDRTIRLRLQGSEPMFIKGYAFLGNKIYDVEITNSTLPTIYSSSFIPFDQAKSISVPTSLKTQFEASAVWQSYPWDVSYS